MRLMFLLISYFLWTSAFATIPVYTQGQLIVLTCDESEFSVKLKSNPTTGYSWFLTQYDANLIALTKHTFTASTNTKLMGAPGYEWWQFQIIPDAFSTFHQTSIHFVYKRPWEKTTNTKDVVFTVNIQCKK